MAPIKVLILTLFLFFFTSESIYANENILILRSNFESFSFISRGIKDDIGDMLNIQEIIIDGKTSPAEIENIISNNQPELVVLIGNRAISKYARFQKIKEGDEQTFPPSIVLSAIYLDKAIHKLTNAIGIRNEIPIVIGTFHIRSIVKTPIKKVGVIYSEWMEELIELDKIYTDLEKFELITKKVPNRVSATQLQYALLGILNSDIDVLWIPNDNLLLTPKLIQNVWMPILKKSKLPIVVGVDELTVSALNFGTFSLTPDYYALGIQAAQMVTNIQENKWKIEKEGLVVPISVVKLLNLKLTQRKQILLNEEMLDQIDHIIK